MKDLEKSVLQKVFQFLYLNIYIYEYRKERNGRCKREPNGTFLEIKKPLTGRDPQQTNISKENKEDLDNRMNQPRQKQRRQKVGERNEESCSNWRESTQ